MRKIKEQRKRRQRGAVFTATRGCIRLSEREKEAEHSACWDAEADLRAGGEVGNQRRVDNRHPEPTVGKASRSLAVC